MRSHSKICAFSLIAHGLNQSQNIEFMQYPPFPLDYEKKLGKLPHKDIAWQDFQVNLLKDVRELSEKLADGYFDLVILADHQAQLTAHQRMGTVEKLTTWIRLLRKHRHKFFSEYAFLTAFPFSCAELCKQTPVCVVDLSDYPYLTPSDVELLRHVALYFKREVPYNRFVLLHHYFQFTALRQAQKDESLINLLPKVRNIPLGIPDDKFHQLVNLRTDTQDIDVFWAGRTSSTMRTRTAELLNTFAETSSWNICIPTERMSFEEYCRVVARSKVSVSVEGGGWDCDRHYESVALGSVPLMNKPTRDALWWHDMPQDMFFENSFSDFTSRLETLLSDNALRQHCLQQIEQRIRKNMLWSKIIEYMVATTLDKK